MILGYPHFRKPPYDCSDYEVTMKWPLFTATPTNHPTTIVQSGAPGGNIACQRCSSETLWPAKQETNGRVSIVMGVSQ